MLWLVGVPIGREGDMTPHAVDILKSADVIAAEDTRKALRLFGIHDITPDKLLSHGAHNEHSSVKGIVNLLMEGKTVAYVSDAGMPCISDPGFLLVRAARAAGIDVKASGGTSALTMGVALSGLSSDRFTFLGFLPRQNKARETLVGTVKELPFSLVIYEAPHRILETLADVERLLGDRNCFVGRELTKTYEEHLTGALSEVKASLENRKEVLGEFVVVIDGAVEGSHLLTDEGLESEILSLLGDGHKVKKIRDMLKEKTPLSGAELYKKIETLKS
ncbi:MAG: 16S rRNA (cytidine(1402)-2'-O)-methyltransferase [Alphaproteobacteria bacterium]|nr:16S rRNA (cytidine(1402)-2'-O)-methyltransferase [Alphaproteobacteria bacterium]